MTEGSTLPDWWPEWMSAPTKYPLGHCRDCSTQQYSMSTREDHKPTCPHWEDPQLPGPKRKVPWPKTYTSAERNSGSL